MKIALKIIRWSFGIFLCLAGLGGLFTPDYRLALVFLLIGSLLLPPVTVALGKRMKSGIPPLSATDNIIHPSKETVQLTQLSLQSTELTMPEKKTGMMAGLKRWWLSIQAAAALESSIKRFDNPKPAHMSLLTKYLQQCPAKEIEYIRTRVIQRCHARISSDNVTIEGPKYLNFYLTLFPTHSGTEIIQAINVQKVEAFLFTKVDDDEALDPKEIEEIISYSASLNVEDYNSKEKIKATFDYYITNWELDNGLFKGIEGNFIMNKNECCIYKSEKCEWFDRKSVTTRVSYGGPSYRMKITKGLSYRVGSYNVSSQKEIVKVSKGTGIINVTTKRIIFKGSETSTTINTSAIIDIEPFSDAVTIFRSKGQPVTIESADAVNLYKYLRSATRRKLINS